MFNAINFAFASETSQLPYPANTTVESAVIQTFLCPSDGQQRVDPTNWGATNYVANCGTGTINSGNFNVVAGAQLAYGNDSRHNGPLSSRILHSEALARTGRGLNVEVGAGFARPRLGISQKLDRKRS